MKRWVWLGLLGGAVACTKVPDRPPVETEDVCPGTEEMSLPAPRAQGLEARPAAEDGSESVLITFRPRVSANAMANTDAFAEDVRRVGAQVSHRFPRLNTIVAEVTPEARAALANNPDVLRVEPNRPVHAFGMPSLAPSLWQGVLPNTRGSVGEYTAGLKAVQATEVWDANNDGELDVGAPSGTNIKVCIIDSGWDDRHPELAAAYIGGKDFLDGDKFPLDQAEEEGVVRWGGGHGTHTAATIAAQLGAGARVRPGEEPNGVAGVAPTVSLLVARVLNVNGDGNTGNVIAAMEWCMEQGANIASLSLGSTVKSDAEELAFKKAHEAGMVAVAATGNRGTNETSFPAGYDTVIAVGAVDSNNAWATFSQYGDFVSLVAPGVGVLSATIVGGAPYGDVQAGGTRFASDPLEYTGVGTYTGRMVYCGLGERAASCGVGATCEGFVALVDRGGGILFQEKARNAIRAGAKAIIMGDNSSEAGPGFTLTEPSERWVPTTSVTLANANTLKGLTGQDVTVDVTGLDYLRQSGTSMATPHVAGVAAVVWSACPALTNVQLRAVLQESARDLGDTGKDQRFGHGLVQAKAAVDLAKQRCPTPAP
ncbi:S8 family serine peptidase [Corallococcus terminator]